VTGRSIADHWLKDDTVECCTQCRVKFSLTAITAGIVDTSFALGTIAVLHCAIELESLFLLYRVVVPHIYLYNYQYTTMKSIRMFLFYLMNLTKRLMRRSEAICYQCGCFIELKYYKTASALHVKTEPSSNGRHVHIHNLFLFSGHRIFFTAKCSM
jgi:hypothetical protein